MTFDTGFAGESVKKRARTRNCILSFFVKVDVDSHALFHRHELTLHIWTAKSNQEFLCSRKGITSFWQVKGIWILYPLYRLSSKNNVWTRYAIGVEK